MVSYQVGRPFTGGAHGARVMEALDETVGEGPAHPCGPGLKVFELEEALVGMRIQPAADLALIAGGEHLHPYPLLFGERDCPVVPHVNGGDGQRQGVDVAPGHAAEVSRTL